MAGIDKNLGNEVCISRVGSLGDTTREKSTGNIISKPRQLTSVTGGVLIGRLPCTRCSEGPAQKGTISARRSYRDE